MKQKRMKHRIIAILFGVFALGAGMFAFIPSAHADEARIDITANPTELPEGGSVVFSFEIANYNADYPMTDVAITYLGTVYQIMSGQQIPPSGSARDIMLTLNVSSSQLGKPIAFLVTWNRNGEPMSQEASITIQQAENPIITVTRTASKTNVKPGEQVVITYTIKNTTKFDMTDITLIDENISDTPIFQNETLRASRTTSYDFTYTMGDESVTSTPLVTYTVNGKTKSFSSIDPLELTMVLIQLDLKVQAGAPTQNGVSFTLEVTNTGTQTISDIAITDERENPVNTAPFSLAQGESTTLSYQVVPLMTEPLRNVKFLLAGTDPFGEPYTLEPADVYEVYPYIDETQISVTVRAETITPWTAKSGKLSARIIITNHSSVELTGITVAETTVGVIKNYDVLPAGDTSFDQDVTLGSPRNLSITVKGYDPTGTNRELANCVMPVAYGTETAAQNEATPIPASGGMSIFSGISSGISKILIVLGVLMVLSLIILVVLTAVERSRVSLHDPEEDEEAYAGDYFETRRGSAVQQEYRREPDPEEVGYTQRMLSSREDARQARTAPEPIRLPPAQPRSAEQPRATMAPNPLPAIESVRAVEPQQQAKEVADRLVQTARSRYPDSQSEASYRPANPDGKPYTPQVKPEKPRPTDPAHPRVFDYQRQAKTQPAQKQTITRVTQNKRTEIDSEEY